MKRLVKFGILVVSVVAVLVGLVAYADMCTVGNEATCPPLFPPGQSCTPVTCNTNSCDYLCTNNQDAHEMCYVGDPERSCPVINVSTGHIYAYRCDGQGCWYTWVAE
jgi:hypothetical protein